MTTSSAQPRSPIELGQRVRVTAPGAYRFQIVGTVAAVDADSLVLTHETLTWRVAVLSVTKLEVSRGRRSHIWHGLGLGYLLGAGVGAAASDCDDRVFMKDVCEAVSIGIGAGAGLLLGAALGAIIKTDRWEEVPRERVRVGVVPQREGIALGLVVAF